MHRVGDSSIVTIESTRVGAKVVLKLGGRMDAVSAKDFETACEPHIAAAANPLVLDLSELIYVSSLGLRSFITVGKALKDQGGELRLCRMSGFVRQLFEITRLITVFPEYDTIEGAVAEN